MFAGFRSRWTMPCSCAASSASAICLAIGSASSSGIGPCATDPPASGRRPAPSPAPRCHPLFKPVDVRDVRMVQRRQHLRFALESRKAIGILREASGNTLIATSRLSFVSRAR